MADNSHQISGVAERYASSLYELAAEAKSVDAVAKDLASFQASIDGSKDLQRLIESPVFSADDQSRSITARAFSLSARCSFVSSFVVGPPLAGLGGDLAEVSQDGSRRLKSSGLGRDKAHPTHPGSPPRASAMALSPP